VARTFLAEGLVDRLILLTGETEYRGRSGGRAICHPDTVPGFRKISSMTFGADHMDEFERLYTMFTGIITDIGRVAAISRARSGRRSAHRNRLGSGRHRYRRLDRLFRGLPDRHGTA
jgi:hypothetical protein